MSSWYVVRTWRGSRRPRASQVYIGSESPGAIWTPNLIEGTPFTYEKAQLVRKIKREPNYRVWVISQEELDRAALEWYLEEGNKLA
jgi:hypothetical protein